MMNGEICPTFNFYRPKGLFLISAFSATGALSTIAPFDHHFPPYHPSDFCKFLNECNGLGTTTSIGSKAASRRWLSHPERGRLDEGLYWAIDTKNFTTVSNGEGAQKIQEWEKSVGSDSKQKVFYQENWGSQAFLNNIRKSRKVGRRIIANCVWKRGATEQS